MKKIFKLFLLFISCLFLITSCKKDSDNSSTETAPLQTQPNIVCDGNGTSSYFPLAFNNSWGYSDGGSNSFNYSISSQTIYNSNTYYNVSSTLGGTLSLRKASNGDIMIYNSATSSEIIFIPANPVNGQAWNYPLEFASTRKVISNAASFTSPTCSYTGCLKIQTLNTGGNVLHTYFYKKGIGMISTDEIATGIVVTKLTSLTLN